MRVYRGVEKGATQSKLMSESAKRYWVYVSRAIEITVSYMALGYATCTCMRPYIENKFSTSDSIVEVLDGVAGKDGVD